MKAWLIAAAAALAFAALALWAPMDGTAPIDDSIRGSWSLTAEEQPAAAMEALNKLGSTAVFAGATLLAAALSWAFGRRRQAVVVIGTVLAALLLNSGLKEWLQRPRPEHAGWIEASGYSFPSGNAMVGMALYGLLAVIAWRGARSGWLRLAAAAAAVLVIGAVGYCRLYFGVHYATDIAAGYAAGLFCAAAGAALLGPGGSRSSALRRRGSHPTFPG
ncbi:phosphatase PAP2 family protein [Paenibacillus pasadenensis]|uniref:Membrane-associated phospholipid phosphatase n=1 Tax=Paenibacillus pasadenensis TaxID=217090 RepID=A0A2N5N1M9_9BACL|nr:MULTISPECIES: phosphatase PAP2 family protein [Paenibacillus]PLT44241.1 Membrane-associated phospholipid phosphatase [Paenibacillus pasadenensis]QGG54766.1 phosphatase PAP2 family protein [Paenibacillus sp. B01]